MTELIQQALNLATPGQLAMALQQRLAKNTEVKIKSQWIRVQHTMHRDRLQNAQDVDLALSENSIAK